MCMSVRRRVAVVAAVGVIVGLLGTAAPAEAASGTTVVTIVSDAGAPAGAQNHTFTSPTAQWQVYPAGTGLIVSAVESGTGHSLMLNLYAPTGTELGVGTYVGARMSAEATNPGIDFAYDGRACDGYQGNGAFRVLEIEREAGTGAILRFAAVFEYRCGSASGGSRGSVYWNSTLAPRARTSWSMSGATTALPGTTVQVAGSLSDSAGVVMAAHSVKEWTTALSSGSTAQANLTTDAAGGVSTSRSLGSVPLQIVYEYAGDATHEPSVGVRTATPVRRTPTLVATMSSPQYVGTTVTVSGKLTDTAGPVAGVEVQVYRSGDEGVTGSTSADGSFSIPYVLPTRGSYGVFVYFAGSFLTDPVSGWVDVYSLPRPTAMTFTGPSSIERGTPYSLSGTLVGYDGVPLAAVPVTLIRQDLAGTTSTIVTTGADGSFTHDDTPEVGGTVTWSAKYLGSPDGNDAPIKRTVVVAVSRLAPSLSMSVPARSYAYGSLAKITVRLGPTFNGRTVTVSGKRANAAKTFVVGSGVVDVNGNFTTTVRMIAMTKLTVTFKGDYRYAPATVSATRWTVARVTTTPLGWFKKVRSVAIYHAGGTPRFGFAVFPGRPGGCLAVVAQRFTGGTWKTVAATSCTHLDTTSKTSLYLVRNSTPGRMRIAAGVAKNGYTLAGSSPWAYFSFV
jgi:hypothetical protein